jgi:signal transduction histidine kinase
MMPASITNLTYLPGRRIFRALTDRQPLGHIWRSEVSQPDDDVQTGRAADDPEEAPAWKPDGPVVEAVVLVAMTLAAYLLGLWLDLFDLFVHALAQVEHLEVDEFILPLLVLAVGLAIFSVRRQRDMQREVERRTKAERILERRNARLQAVDKLKDEFLANAGHELRTPLTSIQGFSEILLSRDLNESRRKHYAEVINEQASLMGQIIENLLDIAQVADDEHLEIEARPVDMDMLIDETLAPFTHHHPEHTIRYESGAETPPVLGEAFQLKRVLRNLVDNAIKYSPEGGAITIRSRAIPGYLEISVQDEGIGLTRGQQKRVFDKFYQVGAPGVDKGGVGVGLTISKLIVESHGGQIGVTSEPGAGSTFTFTVPLVKE